MLNGSLRAIMVVVYIDNKYYFKTVLKAKSYRYLVRLRSKCVNIVM